MVYKNGIKSRIQNIEDIISKKYTKITSLFILKDLDNKYHINNFKDNEVIVYDLNKYYKDNNINVSDKNTHIVCIEMTDDRTEESVLCDN
jgi:hypothetical protein